MCLARVTINRRGVWLNEGRVPNLIVMWRPSLFVYVCWGGREALVVATCALTCPLS